MLEGNNKIGIKSDMSYLIPTMLLPTNIHQSGKSMRLFFTFIFIVMIMIIMMVMMMMMGITTSTILMTDFNLLAKNTMKKIRLKII